MTKTFKIGDIVEANEYTFTTSVNGWRGKVLKVGNGTFDAQTIEGSGSKIGAAYLGLSPKYFDLVTSNAAKQSIEIIEGLTVELTAEQLEEVSRKLHSAKDKAKKAPEPKLKVGDWVRAKVSDNGCITEGKAYQVVDVSGCYPGFINDSGNADQFIRDYEIIDKLTPFDRAGRKPNEFKKGDIVRVMKGGFCEIEDGDIGVIGKGEVDDCPLVRVGSHEYFTYCELVTPVENRVDHAEGADVA